MSIKPIEPLNLDNELSSEFDDESIEMKLARLIVKYQDMPLIYISELLQKYFTLQQVQAAFRIYMENKV